jgi:hypothetical protein
LHRTDAPHNARDIDFKFIICGSSVLAVVAQQLRVTAAGQPMRSFEGLYVDTGSLRRRRSGNLALATALFL